MLIHNHYKKFNKKKIAIQITKQHQFNQLLKMKRKLFMELINKFKDLKEEGDELIYIN